MIALIGGLMTKQKRLPGVKLQGKFFRTTGDYLRYIREGSGLSVLQVSRRLGYRSPSFVHRWESNKRPVVMAQIKRLARFYGRPNLEIRTMIVKFEIIKLKEKWGLYED